MLDTLFRYRLRRDRTAAQWVADNPVLYLGEPGCESDTVLFKVGDDVTAWNDLPYANGRVIGFCISNGDTSTNAGPTLIAPNSGTITKCKLVVKASDAAIDLIFQITQNAASVFLTNNTVAAATAAGTLVTFTNFISTPFGIAADDLFTLDIVQGSPDWAFTVQLES